MEIRYFFVTMRCTLPRRSAYKTHDAHVKNLGLLRIFRSGAKLKKRCLIILCGLKIGGVETYICRLSKALAEQNVEPVVLVLSRKSEPVLVAMVEKYAELIWIDEIQKFRGYTSWLNAIIPLKRNLSVSLEKFFDYVHVVDSLTLQFLALNKTRLQFGQVTIGLYHEQEFLWWQEYNVLFRAKQIELARLNATSILFPNEIIRRDFSNSHKLLAESLPLLPLGVDMPNGEILADKKSLRIVSIGRLVDFKTYNSIIISILPALRSVANFTYEIYGSGPLEGKLRKLASDLKIDDFVTFHGNVAPELLVDALNGAFCFVGSGTTIITSASYGVPSIVGIESNQDLSSGGLFCDVLGYSYNEAACYDEKNPMLGTILDLHNKSQEEYHHTCQLHIKKSSEFDIKNTVNDFLKYFNDPLKMPIEIPSRIRCAASMIRSLIPLFGPGIFKFKRRYLKK